MAGQVKATNNFVFLIRDETETETATKLFIPSGGREKPHTGKVISVGGLVKDPEIKRSKGQKALFHKTVGMSIEYDGIEYLVVQEHEILAIV